MAINCDPSSLANAAICFQQCVPEGMQVALQNYLLAQILHQLNPSSPTDPVSLLKLATAQGNSFIQLDGIQEAVQSYLTCQIAAAAGA